MSEVYTDKTEVQNYIKRNIDAGFDSQLTRYIEAMSRFADTFCGQTLVETTPSTRKFDGNGYTELFIDDVYDITSVVADGATISPYQYPTNKERKNQLVLNMDYFPAGLQNIEVTGKFGRFKVLPKDLQFAVTVLVAGIINQVDKQTDGVKSEKVGEYQVTYADGDRKDYEMAMNILKSYRPIVF